MALKCAATIVNVSLYTQTYKKKAGVSEGKR